MCHKLQSNRFSCAASERLRKKITVFSQMPFFLRRSVPSTECFILESNLLFQRGKHSHNDNGVSLWLRMHKTNGEMAICSTKCKMHSKVVPTGCFPHEDCEMTKTDLKCSKKPNTKHVASEDKSVHERAVQAASAVDLMKMLASRTGAKLSNWILRLTNDKWSFF